MGKLEKEQQELEKKDTKELTFRPYINQKRTIKPKIKKIETQLNQPIQTQTNKNIINKNQKETVVIKDTKNNKKQNKQQNKKQKR